MVDERDSERHYYMIPSHELTGTPEQMLEQLDDVLRGLTALRMLIEREAIDALARRREGSPRSFLRLLSSGERAILMTAAVLLGVPPSARAQAEEEPRSPVTLNATLEGYYEYNFNEPYDRVNALRAYDTRANSFGIQQLALVLESALDVDSGRRYGLRADLQFGQATDTVQGSPANEPRPEIYRNLWQAYGSYVFPVSRGLRADFGKFASMLGYETNYAKDDDHFSRAYLFYFLPFYHAGLRVSYPVADRVTLLYMLTNGIQQTEDFNDFKSSHVAAVVTPVPAISWTLNYYFGREQPDDPPGEGPDGSFRLFDTYVTFAPECPFTLGVDVNHTRSAVTAAGPSGSLYGLGVYGRYQTSSNAAFSARYERLNDEGGLFGGVPQLLQEATVTAEYRFDEGFLVRAELRRDWSDVPFFVGDPSSAERSQSTVLVGMVWWIGGKEGAW